MPLQQISRVVCYKCVVACAASLHVLQLKNAYAGSPASPRSGLSACNFARALMWLPGRRALQMVQTHTCLCDLQSRASTQERRAAARAVSSRHMRAIDDVRCLITSHCPVSDRSTLQELAELAVTTPADSTVTLYRHETSWKGSSCQSSSLLCGRCELCAEQLGEQAVSLLSGLTLGE